MSFSQQLAEKWKPVLDHEALPKIEDNYKRQVTAILLENQEKALIEEQAINNSSGLLTEAAPTSSTGSTTTGVAGLGGDAASPRQGYDPVLISLIRRSTPQ